MLYMFYENNVLLIEWSLNSPDSNPINNII